MKDEFHPSWCAKAHGGLLRKGSANCQFAAQDGLLRYKYERRKDQFFAREAVTP